MNGIETTDWLDFMSIKMNRTAYRQIIAEDLAWLESLPRTLERDHVIEIVKASEKCEYPLADGEEVIGHDSFDFTKIDLSNKEMRNGGAGPLKKE